MKILEKISGQIGDILEEIRSLSKKNPNDAVNKFKLRYINQVITDANKILEKKRMPFEDFIGFNEDELPSNSDVTFILSQYDTALTKYSYEV
jgi:hypothetical protein